MAKQDKIMVIYDADPDGFGSAWAAWKKFGDAAEYVEVLHGSGLPIKEYFNYDRIYIFDLSFKREEFIQNMPLSRTVVIDHHPSAKELIEELNLNPLPFDTERAACVQVWEYLHGTDAPPLLQYVADRDTWAWKLMDSEYVNNMVYVQDLDFVAWDTLNTDLNYPAGYDYIVNAGKAIQAFKDTLVKEMADQAVELEFMGMYVPLTTAPVLHSEVGHELLKRYPDAPFSLTYMDVDEERKYSLRSEDHRLNVGALAKIHGGGGHHNAAGFSLSWGEVWQDQKELYDAAR
jgi:oligoribonuclease NrnB/cAMP/cGMP phosphodiesterase (DHH superfamily)